MIKEAIQVIDTVENVEISLIKTEAQEIDQEDAKLFQDWANLYNAIFNQNTSPIPLNPPTGSGAASTVHNDPNQQPTPAHQQTGHGSGSGASTTAHEKIPTQGAIKPMTSPTGFGSALPAGSGSGSGSLLVYTWDPHKLGSGTGQSGSGSINYLYSNFHNWLIDGQPQNGATGSVPDDSRDEALFNGALNDDPIEWNDPQFEIMNVINGYNGLQTIDPGITIELLGTKGASLSMDGSSWLNLAYASNTSVFKIDNNASITNMQLGGNSGGNFIIDGGTTTVAGNFNYTVNIGVQVWINKGATLNDESQAVLTLTHESVNIYDNGTMNVNYSTNLNTIIDRGTFNLNYIYAAGTLRYSASGDVTNTFNIPIKINSGGAFLVTNDELVIGNAKLIVKGNCVNTQGVSVYMGGDTSTVQLTDAILEADSDYLQGSGILETMDKNLCTLQDGAIGLGNTRIDGGSVKIDQPNVGYGELDVKAATLRFAGELDVGIQGNQLGQNDLLNVTGSMNLLAPNSLGVTINGQLGNGKWTIITTGGNNIAQFTNGANPAPGLTGHNNQPNPGKYQLTSP